MSRYFLGAGTHKLIKINHRSKHLLCVPIRTHVLVFIDLAVLYSRWPCWFHCYSIFTPTPPPHCLLSFFRDLSQPTVDEPLFNSPLSHYRIFHCPWRRFTRGTSMSGSYKSLPQAECTLRDTVPRL